MRFFSFDSVLSSEEIKRRCLYLLETEEHSPWNIFKEYTSARWGLHLYQADEDFVGYFESGERNRQDSLQRAKVWFKIKIKEKKRQGNRKGIYVCQPTFHVDYSVRDYQFCYWKGIFNVRSFLANGSYSSCCTFQRGR